MLKGPLGSGLPFRPSQGSPWVFYLMIRRAGWLRGLGWVGEWVWVRSSYPVNFIADFPLCIVGLKMYRNSGLICFIALPHSGPPRILPNTHLDQSQLKL